MSAQTLVASETVAGGLASVAAGAVPARVTIVGFGRFGRAVLRSLLQHPALPGDGLVLQVVDKQRAVRLVGFEDDLIAARVSVDVRASADVEAWIAELPGRAPEDRPGIVFLCVDNDPLALRAAASLRESVGDVVIVVRVARRTQPVGDARFLTCSVTELFERTVVGLLG